MNIVLLEATDFIAEDRAVLSGDRFNHIKKILKVQPGDSIRVGFVNGNLGHAKILDVNNDSATLQTTLDSPPPPELPLTLVLALVRPKMLKRCLRMVAELGIKELHIINCSRVEKSFWQSPVVNSIESASRGYFLQGLEQAMDTRLPHLYLHRGFKDFVRQQLPVLINAKRSLLAHPAELRAAQPPMPVQKHGRRSNNLNQKILLCIGPEGGFIPYEVEQFAQLGFELIDLGSRPYRVETVLPLLIGKLFHSQ